MRLCVGGDWAEVQHDIEVMGEAGTALATRRLSEGVVGIGELHELISRFVPGAGRDSAAFHPSFANPDPEGFATGWSRTGR